ncbi:MAG: hypothetical protein QOJ32_2449 [Frankiaceae bacterium]|nr:hypothetical protein [Frankiaceae bacterium]
MLSTGGAEIAVRLGWFGPLHEQRFTVLAATVAGILAKPS